MTSLIDSNLECPDLKEVIRYFSRDRLSSVTLSFVYKQGFPNYIIRTLIYVLVSTKFTQLLYAPEAQGAITFVHLTRFELVIPGS